MAARSTASPALQVSRVASGRGTPVASMAAPPTRASVNENSMPAGEERLKGRGAKEEKGLGAGAKGLCEQELNACGGRRATEGRKTKGKEGQGGAAKGLCERELNACWGGKARGRGKGEEKQGGREGVSELNACWGERPRRRRRERVNFSEQDAVVQVQLQLQVLTSMSW